MIFSLSLVFSAVLLSGISQVLMKIGSAHQGKRNGSILAAYLNLPTLFAYGLLLFVTGISVIALKEIPLKTFYAISSLGFVVVMGLSWGLLREKITRDMIIALVLISSGVIFFNV